MENQTSALKWQSIIRALLITIGGFLIGKNIFGANVTPEFWQTASGIVLSIASLIWAIVDKTATVEVAETTVQQLLLFVGGLLVAAGRLTDSMLEQLLALIPIIISLIQGYTSRLKVKQLETGQITTSQLSGSVVQDSKKA